jgi:hypothetical protein
MGKWEQVKYVFAVENTPRGLNMFHQLVRNVAIAAAVVGAVGSINTAVAAPAHDFGLLDSSTGSSVTQFEGGFDNVYSFTAAYSGVTGAVTGLDVYGDLTTQYRVGFGATPTWLDWSASASMPSDDDGFFAFSRSYGGLVAGQTYWFELKGSATQGAYSVTLAPVPEPESWALLLSGLGLMGFVARRRRLSAV